MMNSQRIANSISGQRIDFDRNGKLLVENQPAYDLMVIPCQVKDFDTTELITILGIDKDMLIKNMVKCRKYSPFQGFCPDLSDHGQQICRIAGKITQISGIFHADPNITKV